MNKPSKIVMTPGRTLGVDVLSRSLYPSLVGAVGELVYNGFDAASIRGVMPEIEIRFWATGEHPLSPDGPAISVLDNGTGLTPKALEAYCKVGESVHVGKTHIHGTHGVGKLAAFTLGPKEGASYYLTTNTGGGTWMYHITSDVFAAGGFEPIPVTMERPGLPKEGPFTEIFIPRVEEGLTPAVVRKELPALLPLRPWSVKVQGEVLRKRVLKFEAVRETEVIPLLKGPVRIEFGVAEISAGGDAVHLIDANSKRSVGDLHSIPPAARQALDSILLNPKLVGQIFVPDLERQSAASRTGLRAEFWTSKMGKKLIEVLLAFAVPLAYEVLKEEKVNSGGLKKVVTQLSGIFDKGFGPPDLKSFKSKGEGSAPPKEPSGHKPSSGRPSRRQESGPNPSNLRSGQKPSGVYVRVEDATYQVLESSSKSELPALVRGHTIMINTDHPAIRALDPRASRAMLETTVDMILWAHLLSTREMNYETLAVFYQLRARALAS